MYAAQFVYASLFIGIAAAPLLVVGFWYRRIYVLPIVACGGILLGVGFGLAALGERSLYKSYIGSEVTLEGRLKEDASTSASGKSLQLDEVQINSLHFPGTVLVSAPKSDIKRGDKIRVQGELRAGFGSFPAAMSRARILEIIPTVTGDVGRVARDWFADKVRVGISEPQASLGIGFLTGQKSALPEDLADALKVAGLTHIVVASGYNLTILVRLARRLFVKVSKFLAAVSSGVMITLFMAITGLSPSMTRAGLVSGLSLASWYYGHRFHPLVLLPFAAAITVAIQPSYVWGDLGWQLSFAAFAGVMIVAPLLQRYFFGAKEPNVLRQILGETVAAHIVTVPIIASSFGVVSNVAIIANVLVVPLVPLAMLLTFICGIWSIVGLPFLFLVGVPTQFLLGYMTTVATYVSELSWAQSDIAVDAWVWGVYVLVIAGACVWMWRATHHDLRGTDPIF